MAELSIFEYIETFYNTKRRHKQLNNLTILEYQKLINNNTSNGTNEDKKSKNDNNINCSSKKYNYS